MRSSHWRGFCVYLPIDPHYPKERIDYILADTKAKLILTNQEYTLPTDFHAETLLVNEAFLGEKPNLPLINSPSDLAYVIYTSGSTGKPKGVMLEHRGIANLKCFFEKKLGITSAERIAQFATCSFDASVWEIFMALLNGASLYLVDEDIINDYTKFGRFLHDNQITVVTLPPPYLVNLEWKGDLALKKIITAGSATNIELVNKWKDKVEYYNAYGPTETTICATVWREEGNPLEQLVPIGTPIYNTKVYIMNTDHQVQPIGVPGELCISGVGLARGYLNRPELTKERFVANPYLPGQVMYKTGDLARWLPDGNIEFLGRIDEQVKIRGYRVEIGEIEIVISSHEKVKEAAVVTKRDKNGEMYLVAYYTSDSLPADELRAYLSEKLPEYMIPSFLFKIDKIPVTPSGKFDKKYLQSIEESSLFRPQFEPPRTELEKKLVKIWEEVLGVPQVGINDCFLDLGGHSLKAIEAVYKMHKEGMDIKVGDLFRFPKLKDLAEHLGKQNRKQLIKDLTEANKELVKEFGTNVRLISYEVNSHPKLVLYIGRELSAKRLQILKYLKEKLDPSLCPHYLRFASDFAALGKETRLDEVGFEKALGFTAKHWWNYLAVLGHLFRMTKKYTKTVRKGIAITRSKPVAIQKIHLKLANQISGNIYTFDEFVYDSGLLRKAIALVVKEQAVLRSVFVKRKKEIWWEEREPKGELRIPFLDLSQWKTKCRERMGALLASYYFRKNLFRYNMPLYTPILIKENYRKHHLLFPCDHSIFDGMSGEILYRKIKDYYRKIEENPDEEGVNVSTAPSYLDYLKTLEKGPQFIDERQLIATFQLEHFYESLVEIGKNQKRSVPCLLEREINLPPEIRKSGLDSIWDMTFYLFVRLCHRYFNIPTVPARIVYYGRHYGQQTFFDTLGEFIDVVPVCVPMEKAPDQMDTIASLVRKLLAQIPEKNLNFVNLMYNNNSNAKWEKVSRLLFLPSPSTPWLLFNFQGNFSVDEIQKIKNLFNHNKTVKKFPKTQNNLLLFNVMYSAEKIYITLNCSYGYDHEKLMKILREETERIFYNHK